MRGDLSETSVADLCRGLSDAEATGAVELDGPEGAARVFFRSGNVYWAMSPAPRARLGDRLVNGGLLTAEQLEQALAAQRESSERLKLGAILADQGLVTRDVIRVFVQEQILDALFDLMRWNAGSYAFRAGDAASEKLPIDIPVDQLLVEVSRRQSEWDQIQAVIPDLDMVPDFVLGGSSANAALEPDEFAVLASVDGHRSIRELADSLGYSEFEAARIVYGLTLLGIVDVSDEADESESDDLEDVDDLYGEVAGAFDRPAPTTPAADEVAEDVSDDASEDADQDVAADIDVPDDEPAQAPAASTDTDLLGDLQQLDDLEEGDLELELSDLADDDVDIAAALEEALAGSDPATTDTPPEPPSSRPQVRVHVDDDLTDYVPPRTVTEEGLPPAGEPIRRTPIETPPPSPVAAARAAEIEETDTDELSAALAEALEVEPATATAPEPVDDDSSDEGPEPWVASPADLGIVDEPETPAPEAVARLQGVDEDLFGAIADAEDDDTPLAAPPAEETRVDLDVPVAEETPDEPAARTADPIGDDSDFDALIDQLAGPSDSGTAGKATPYTSSPRTAAASAEPEDEPAPASDPEPARAGGDVSEFLRELSRLALDEPGDAGGAAPAAESDEDKAPQDERDAAASAAADARESARNEAEDKKKRGLFGWGR